ncbi:hypothetical protein RF11_08790 [Thelohanellus kitauei]|uniref:Uncharacterized protein n=1 Tax=Thelohanellus kitauei TaxID=669202 RepID=A0A0C2J0G3_THEKT|nr:hypothetical protein RF11_08790 [Thelohanellus kitauei]
MQVAQQTEDEAISQFYKVHSKLAIIRERRFNDTSMKLSKLDFNFMATRSEESPELDPSLFTITCPEKYFEELVIMYRVKDQHFLHGLIHYFNANSQIITTYHKVEFFNFLHDSNVIEELINLLSELSNSIDDSEDALIHFDLLITALTYAFNFCKKKFQISHSVSTRIFKHIYSLLLTDFQNPKQINLRKVIKLLRMVVSSFLGDLKHLYKKKQKYMGSKNGKIINFQDSPKMVRSFIPQLEYRKKCLKYQNEIEAPLNVSHRQLASFVQVDNFKELESLYEIIMKRNPLYDNIDEITENLRLPFEKKLYKPRNGVTFIFERFIMIPNDIIKIFGNILKRFEDEHVDETTLKKYQSFGLNCFDFLDENLFENFVNPDRLSQKSYNIKNDLLKEPKISNVFQIKKLEFALSEIQRYRNSIANDISYLLLLIAKQLKSNHGYQVRRFMIEYMYYVRKLQDSRIFDILMQYIADFRSLENCQEFIKLNKLFYSSSPQENPISHTNKDSFDHLKYIELYSLHRKNDRPPGKMDILTKTQKRNYFVKRFTTKLEMIGNVLHMICTLCKHSYSFAEYLKTNYRSLLYNLLIDIKSQKLLYYIPKIHTYLLSVTILKNYYEFDRIFARDEENYCVGIEYYQ